MEVNWGKQCNHNDETVEVNDGGTWKMVTDPHGILRKTDHRPYPLPSGPWIMRQTWSKVLFAHWSFPPRLIQPLLPPGLELDTFEHQAYISVLPFRISGVRIRMSPPIPGATEMLQINIRTYVKRDDKPGIYFFALDTDHLPTVWLTQLTLGLPYHHARISLKNRFKGYISTVECISQRLDTAASNLYPKGKQTVHKGKQSREDGALHVSYYPSSDARQAKVDSLEHWLTERYCMYTVHAGKLLRLDIHHHPWSLQTANAEFHRQSLLTPMQNKLGFDLPVTPSLVEYAERIEALMWLPKSVK
jgi:uncharacterized protein